jgi:hypothetical protein
VDEPNTDDEMARVERRAAILRHDLRNRFAAIRNAAFYLRRKVARTELWEEDPRMSRFFELIDGELAKADDTLRAELTAARLWRGPDGDDDE